VRREIYFGEITKSELCQRFQVRKECVGVKLRRDSDKDPTERERSVEGCEVMVGIPLEGIGIMNNR
jgi:hypothetical protein